MKLLIVRSGVRVFVVMMLLLASIGNAKAVIPADKLVESCSELMGVYKNRSEKNLLAAQTTSLSEALRAGYCRGVLDQYRRSNRLACNGNDWFSMAEFIARQQGFSDKFTTATLLQTACRG